VFSPSTSFTITVVPQSAQPVADAFYTGPAFYWTTGSSSSTATLTLTASLRNRIGYAGDIRTAKVSFYVRNGITLTPITGAQNLPVGLVTASDSTVGTAGTTVQYSIGNNTAAILDIAVKVSGNYTADDPATDQSVMIAVPVPGGQICGGGTIDNATGFGSSGFLKGSAANPAVFTFFVKYTKSGSNPQGGVEITVRSFYKTDGSLDTSLHTYRLKSTAISVLAVNNTNTDQPAPGLKAHSAQFSSKANVAEIVNGSEVSVEGNCIMQITMTEASPTSCAGDTLAISVQRSKGGLWFTSNWDGTKTTEKTIICPGGDLSVK